MDEARLTTARSPNRHSANQNMFLQCERRRNVEEVVDLGLALSRPKVNCSSAIDRPRRRKRADVFYGMRQAWRRWPLE